MATAAVNTPRALAANARRLTMGPFLTAPIPALPHRERSANDVF